MGKASAERGGAGERTGSEALLYSRIASTIRTEIALGRFPVGSWLPTEAKLCERFGVSLITVRQALRDLEADGLIRKRSAKPAVVAAKAPTVNLSWKFKNFADIAAFTHDARLTIKSYRREASPVLEKVFGLDKGERGFCLRAVLIVGDQRKAQITSFFPPEIGSQLSRADFDDALIFQSVQHHLGIRMEVARRLIRDEGLCAAEAARRVGIHHLGRFSATYRQAFGVLPSADIRRDH